MLTAVVITKVDMAVFCAEKTATFDYLINFAVFGNTVFSFIN